MDVSASTVVESGVESGASLRTLKGVHLVSEPATAAPPSAEPVGEAKDLGGGKTAASGEDSTSDKPPLGDDSATPGGSGGSRTNRKRKRTRNRRNKKKYVPYSKLSWQERRERDERETRRANKIREKMFLSGQPVAPYNTTQFLIEDHNESIEIDAQQLPRHKRARDSSFSYDSDEDFYYSSPEDEEEYYLKDFASTYDSLHSDQLQAQTKTKLVQDVLALEKRVESLQKEMIELKGRCQDSGEDKVLLYKAEITKLSEENNRLRAENECLRRKCISDPGNPADESSSVDSESDSNSSTGSSSSQEEVVPEPEQPPPGDCLMDGGPPEAPPAGAAEQ